MLDLGIENAMTTLRQINNLLAAEILEVTGCTEPASVAFAFLCARRHLRNPLNPKTARARLYSTSDVLRNASTAIVPFLKRRGLRSVVAAGLSAAADRFNLFPAIDRRMALVLLKRRSWLTVCRVRRKGVYVKAVLSTPEESVAVVIQGRHDEIRSISRNGKIIYRARTRPQRTLNLSEAWATATKRDRRLENTARDFIIRQVRGDSSKALPARIASPIRARMRGSSSPVMTITGSGNQGIFLGVPLHELYGKRGRRILPATLFSLLAQIHLSKKNKRISDKCGLATKAAPALAAGLAFAEGRDLNDIRQVMRDVERHLQHMRCYGAQASCGNKAARACRQVLQSLRDKRPVSRKGTFIASADVAR
jgi:L-cysteine desulfidase